MDPRWGRGVRGPRPPPPPGVRFSDEAPGSSFHATNSADMAARPSQATRPSSMTGRHEHRTAKVIELVGSSTASFDEAIRNALEDASSSTRGISGVHVLGQSIKCKDGHIVEYKVDLRVSFGIERTAPP